MRGPTADKDSGAPGGGAEAGPSRFERLLAGRFFLPACLTAAVLLRVLAVLIFSPEMKSDCAFYLDKGAEIAAGMGYNLEGKPTNFMPVGYSGFLALVFFITGPSVLAAKFANILLFVGIAVLSYLVAKAFGLAETTARIAVLLLSVYPNMIFYTLFPLSEFLFAFLVLAGVYAMIRWPKKPACLLLAGILFGLSYLTKPQALFIPVAVVVAGWIYSRRIEWKRAFNSLAVIYAALVLTCVPWAVRNYYAIGHPTFGNGNGGVNLAIGNSEFTGGNNPIKDVFKRYGWGTVPEYEVNSAAGKDAIRYMLDHPWTTIKRWPGKIYEFLYYDAESVSYVEMWSPVKHGKTFWRALKYPMQAFYVAIMGLFLASIIGRLRGRGGYPPPISATLFIYFCAVSCVIFGQPRYHFPLMPFIIIDAAAVIAMARSGRWRGNTVLEQPAGTS